MATDFDIARSQYENYRYCYDNGHDRWVALAGKCFDFWSGNQWDAAVRAQLRREGRPALTLNVIRSLVRSAKGIQRALRNDVRFTPVYDATLESARVQDAVWLHTQNQNQFEFLETEVYEKGLIMGRAYFDVRVSYDESTQGEVKIRTRRSQDVVLDPSVDAYDSDEWPQVITRRWVSHDDLVNLYGKEKADAIGFTGIPSWYDYEDKFMSQQMGRMPYYQHELMSDVSKVRGYLLVDRQYHVIKRKEVFVDMQTGDVSEIPETWERNRIARVLETVPGLGTMKRKMKTVRWDVTCEMETLHSDDSPYRHFTTVPYFPEFIDGITSGAVEDLLDPQEMFNKVTSQELHIINSTANGGYKVKRGALQNMSLRELEEIGSKTGVVVELDELTNLEKLVPNQTPQGHDRLSFKADQIMRSLSGVSDSGRGFARDDASGSKVTQDQAAQDINFAGYLSNLHRTKQLVARNVLDAVQAHYTESRTILINRGTALSPDMESIDLNQPTAEGAMLNDTTRGRYSTVLVPSPSRTAMSEADFDLMLRLRTEVGISIPDAMMIELSPAVNKAQIIAKLDGDSNEREQAAQEAAAAAAQADLEKSTATARKEEAAALLNQARAEKAAIEAASDPDASYERVESARIEATRERDRERLDLDYAKLGETKSKNQQDAALRLTELDVNRESANADRDIAKRENRPAKRREKKPGAQESKR